MRWAPAVVVPAAIAAAVIVAPLAAGASDLPVKSEADVLRLVAAGLTNAEIARRLSVSEATVKTHLNHAYTKAGLQNRAEAVEYAKRHGLGPEAAD